MKDFEIETKNSSTTFNITTFNELKQRYSDLIKKLGK